MARDAFDLSERFETPVLLRLTTRLSHARGAVRPSPGRPQNRFSMAEDAGRWMLLPAFARRNYLSLIEKQTGLAEWSGEYRANIIEIQGRDRSLAVITAGLGGNYYEENREDFIKSRGARAPARLHIGAYPLPVSLIRQVCAEAERIIVIEEGQPFIEEKLRGLLPQDPVIQGKLDGLISRTGELDPDTVRRGLGLPPLPGLLSSHKELNPQGALADAAPVELPRLPGRPPQLCRGCPHGDSYETIKRAAALIREGGDPGGLTVCSDIGCYSLGAMPPYAAIESIVCMGASIGMARGAAEAGLKYALAVIGDSTFLHSGITGLIDAVAADTPMTVIILDNSIVAMTGCQETMIPSAALAPLILGLGVKGEHLLELEAKKPLVEENALKLKKEIEHPGLSVVIFKRECLEALRKWRKKENPSA
jgi:indolepyruvate ferredoxin oxidoreductase alpha subunit